MRDNDRRTVFLLFMFPASFILLAFALAFAALSMMDDGSAAEFGLELLKKYAGVNPAGFPDLYAAAGYALAVSIPIIAVALGWIAISYFFGDRMMLDFAGARRALESRPEIRPVLRTVENVALAAGLPTPAVYIVDDESLNAFATGRSPASASIALTSGILKKLDPVELEGVIAHEMAHIKNRDMRLNMLIITGFGVLAFMADIAMRMIRSMGNGAARRSSGKSSQAAGGVILVLFAVWLALVIFNFFVAPVISMAVSRTREYAADASAALLTRNPKALASALGKIGGDSAVEALAGKKSFGLACIAWPHAGIAPGSLMASHPPIEARIERLLRM
jgi:heat shock protein HtpX